LPLKRGEETGRCRERIVEISPILATNLSSEGFNCAIPTLASKKFCGFPKEISGFQSSACGSATEIATGDEAESPSATFLQSPPTQG
jgi:hypothetical protein